MRSEAWDPDVTALLDELARGERSHLFRGSALPPRPQDVVRPSLTGASAVERKLLDVHRHELARLLTYACYLELQRDRSLMQIVDRSLTNRTDHPLSHDWANRTRHLAARDDRSVPGDWRDVRTSLERCLDGACDVDRLAAASIRLVPNAWPQFYLGMHCVRSGTWSSARAAFRAALDLAPTDWCASMIWEWIAHCELLSNRPEEALACYRVASSTTEDRSYPAASWLFHSMQLGHERGVSEACEALDRLARNDESGLVVWGENMVAARHELGWKPTAAARHRAKKLRNAAPFARRILDVVEG